MSALVAKELQAQNKILEQLVGNYILDKTYPVGTIYTSKNSTSPGLLFGGTWERIKDVFLLAAGDNYPSGSTGGSATHTLTQAEMPPHAGHLFNNDGVSYNGSAAGKYLKSDADCWGTAGAGGRGWNDNSGEMYPDATNRGDGTPFSIMPPYLSVYAWVRTA